MRDIEPRVYAIFDIGAPAGETMVAVQPARLAIALSLVTMKLALPAGFSAISGCAEKAKGSSTLAMIGRPMD